MRTWVCISSPPVKVRCGWAHLALEERVETGGSLELSGQAVQPDQWALSLVRHFISEKHSGEWSRKTDTQCWPLTTTHTQVYTHLSSQVHTPTQIHTSTTLYIQYAYMFIMYSMHIGTIYTFIVLYMYIICIIHGVYYSVYMYTTLYMSVLLYIAYVYICYTHILCLCYTYYVILLYVYYI